MQEVIRYALIGLGIGALYALASQGLILIYRGSGVLNFAHGAIGMAAAYAAYELQTSHGWPFLPAFVVAVAFSAAIGAVTHLLIMRPLRRASPLARVVATLGVLVVLDSIAYLRYHSVPVFPRNELGVHNYHLFGEVAISEDRLWLVVIATGLSVILWAVYRYTRFGLATAAVAENQRAAATLGWSPDLIATANWTLGSALAGSAAILIAPIITLQVSIMTSLVLAAMATALVASFRSFPIALGAGLAVGIIETEFDRWVPTPGLGTAVPFFVIILVMVVRGQALPLRDFFLQRLPRVGNGRIRPVPVLLGIGAVLALIFSASPLWIDSITVTFATAVLLLSIVVLTGYTGQLSMAQYAMAGFGAWVAGRLLLLARYRFWEAVVVGVVEAAPLGVAFALPAVRTRGINLAIVTLGFGSALEVWLYDKGGFFSQAVPRPRIFGADIDDVFHPTGYSLFTFGCFVIAALAVANVRRGRTGRRLIAVRTNERAAAALGINVVGAKLYAFGLAGSLAALGGILLAFQNDNINYSDFQSLTSVTDVAYAVIGGIGYILGPVVGALLAPGALGPQVANSAVSGLAAYVPLATGGLLILLMLQNQDGVVKGLNRWANTAERAVRSRLPARLVRPPRPVRLPPEQRRAVRPRTLDVIGLTVDFGPVRAVNDVSLSVRPGRILGLIGPNGAGKTTFIDAVTGFTRPTEGTIWLDGRRVDHWSAVRRARAGVSRSFQSLELFEDATVLDNLRVASDPRDLLSYARDLIFPRTPTLPGEVTAAVREFGLEPDLHTEVGDLPYGKRRLLAIARAVATRPSVLLLDEPAAGLGDAETAELGRLVRRLADEWGMSILLIEHDMQFVMTVCDDLVVLDFGRAISEGSPADVRADPAVIAAYLGDVEDTSIETAPA